MIPIPKTIPFFLIEIIIGLIFSFHYSYRALRHGRFELGMFMNALFVGFAWSSIIGVICFILHISNVSLFIEVTRGDFIPPTVGFVIGLGIHFTNDHIRGLIDGGLMNPPNIFRRFFPRIDTFISYFVKKPFFTFIFFVGFVEYLLSLKLLQDITIFGSSYVLTSVFHLLLLIIVIQYSMHVYRTYYPGEPILKAIYEYINKQTLSLHAILLSIGYISASILRIVINILYYKAELQINFSIIDIIILSVLTPITEEVIFRGMFQSQFGINYASALFTFIHLPKAFCSTKNIFPITMNPLLSFRYITISNIISSSTNPIVLIIFYLFQIFIIGLILGIIKEKTNSIVLPIMLHSLHNFILIISVFDFTSIR